MGLIFFIFAIEYYTNKNLNNDAYNRNNLQQRIKMGYIDGIDNYIKEHNYIKEKDSHLLKIIGK